ncbi:MAG: tetratricopeptide repeat protein, partial [Acidobacteriota bacterium]
MSDRLTRKEIKRQDSFQTAMGTGLEYVQRHRSQLILGVVAVVVLVLAATAWSLWSASREDRAQELLAEAIQVYGAPVGADAADGGEADADTPTFSSEEERWERAAELFGEVHDRFGSTDAGGIAGVYLGKIALAEGDTERARALWRDFVDDGDHALAAEVRLNLLRLDRAEGDAERVATELEGMLARQSKPLPGDVILHE